jgi:hypothetical protein
MKTNEELKTISFSIEEQEFIKISPDGFFYKGEKIDDVHNVYERFNEWLKQSEIEKNK